MNIYVSNLSFHTTEEDLKRLFSEFGEVSSAKAITDKLTNKPRGFAFVEMPNDEEGKQAIQKLNGKEIQGRMLNVTVARPKEDSRGFGQRNNRW